MNNILYVIVLYNQRVDDCKTYRTLFKESSIDRSLYLFDNSPLPQHSESDFCKNDNIYYTSNSSNPGLSYAYNRAAEYAREHNFEWILILDQDTTFPADIFSKYEMAIEQNHEIKLFAPNVLYGDDRALSPTKLNWKFNSRSICVQNAVLSARDYSVINSGMMINVEAFFRVGGYEQSVWLDFSDIYFVEKFSKHYDKLFIIDSCCYQEFSNDVQTKEQKITRFKVFCDCLRAIPKESLSSKFCYAMLVLRRVVGLTITLRSVRPLFIMVKRYL